MMAQKAGRREVLPLYIVNEGQIITSCLAIHGFTLQKYGIDPPAELNQIHQPKMPMNTPLSSMRYENQG